MTGTDAGGRGLRGGALELADELRAISEALVVNELSGDALVEAAELARALRRRLDGPRRPRWYDADARDAYQEQSPVRGELNPIAPPLLVEYTEREDGTPVVRGRARLGMAYEGPPLGVHGGWIAALFDDLLGAAQRLVGRPGVTGILEIKYRQITPLDEGLCLEAWVHRDRGRRLVVRGTCHAGGVLTAEATGLFVRVDLDGIREKMEGRVTG